MPANTLWCVRIIATCMLLVLPLSQIQAAEPTKSSNTKIIKWVDDKGVTHYGDTLPAQFANKNSVINSQGITIQRNDPRNQSVEESPEAIEQQRKDRALMASFTNEQEIDLARDRHLQMDEITVQGLEQRRVTAVKKLDSNRKFADGFKQRNKPVPPDLGQDLKDNQAEIGRIDTQIKQQQDIMDATKKRFAADKQRFIDLKAHTAK
ncbi:MAG TPA: DUF4124 domain-containing protein [Methylophilaceae bacterium]|nr:DUF4124 domain-containing protein [Methylophilaceae bacterium]